MLMQDLLPLIIIVCVAVVAFSALKGVVRIIIEIILTLFALYLISDILGLGLYDYVIRMFQSFLNTLMR